MSSSRSHSFLKLRNREAILQLPGMVTSRWRGATLLAVIAAFATCGDSEESGKVIDPPPQQYVMVVAQGRSGSTLFSNMICQNRTDIFGVFEPFHDYQDVTTAAGDLNLPSGLNWQALFDCSFADDHTVIGAVGWRGQGRHRLADQIKHLKPTPDPSTLPWGEGRRPLKEERLFRLRPGAGRAGFDFRYAPYIKQACQTSGVRIVKTIRLYGWLLDQFDGAGGDVASPPNGGPPLKIIHLIRHPAELGKSWERFTRKGRWAAPIGVNDFDSRLRLMCRMSSALIVALRRIPEDRQIVVRYEDVVSDPSGTMERVFRFIGASFNETDAANAKAALQVKHGPKVKHSGDPHMNETEWAKTHAVSDDTRALCEPILQLGGYSLSDYNSRQYEEKKRDGLPSAVIV